VIQIRRILCPVDFSEFSRRALEYAAALSRLYEAELTVLHVGPLGPTVSGRERTPSQTALAPLDGEPLAEELRSLFGETADHRPTPELRVLSGPVVGTILDVAGEVNADLIVLGTHGRTGFERFVLGSVTEKIVRKAPCPVLTVSRRAADAPAHALFARVLCGADFSAASGHAVDYALSLAEAARGRVTLLHVVEQLPNGSLSKYPEFDLERYRCSLMKDARAKLEGLVPKHTLDSCDPDTRVACGKPYQEILRTAREERSDLIVLGVHGHGPIDRMLFGSTTQAVVRQAACPVLSVRT
jgi:nucleotide-binding universal stress UspA family protein